MLVVYNGMMFAPFVKIGLLFQKLKEGKQTQRDDLISIHYFLKKGMWVTNYLKTGTENGMVRRFCSFGDDQDRTHH
jgi:hypothetical protein